MFYVSFIIVIIAFQFNFLYIVYCLFALIFRMQLFEYDLLI